MAWQPLRTLGSITTRDPWPDSGAEWVVEGHEVSVHFAGIRAVHRVDFAFHQGEILGLIGPNGAGKTTLINALSGFQPLTSGSVSLNGHDITGMTPDRLGRGGITRTFQGVRTFSELTVRENVEVAALATGQSTRQAVRRADELLALLNLDRVERRSAETLPYGLERRLGIARALATSPRMVMLDEPAAGLNEHESDELLVTLQALKEELSFGLLLIEHDMRLVLRLCDRLHVLDHGRTIFDGPPELAQRNELVLDAYLGRKTGSDADRA